MLSSPEQADGTNTFHFGSRDEDETGLEWCEAECSNKAECQTFTFYSNFETRADWRGDCLGKTDFDDTWEAWIYATSGERTLEDMRVGTYMYIYTYVMTHDALS